MRITSMEKNPATPLLRRVRMARKPTPLYLSQPKSWDFLHADLIKHGLREKAMTTSPTPPTPPNWTGLTISGLFI